MDMYRHVAKPLVLAAVNTVALFLVHELPFIKTMESDTVAADKTKNTAIMLATYFAAFALVSFGTCYLFDKFTSTIVSF